MKDLIALALVACLGCGDAVGPDCSQSSPCRLTIESNTSWSGALGGASNTQSYDGAGDGWIEYWARSAIRSRCRLMWGTCARRSRRRPQVTRKRRRPSASSPVATEAHPTAQRRATNVAFATSWTDFRRSLFLHGLGAQTLRPLPPSRTATSSRRLSVAIGRRTSLQ